MAAAALHTHLDGREPLGVGRKPWGGRPSVGVARGHPSNKTLLGSESRRLLTLASAPPAPQPLDSYLLPNLSTQNLLFLHFVYLFLIEG